MLREENLFRGIWPQPTAPHYYAPSRLPVKRVPTAYVDACTMSRMRSRSKPSGTASHPRKDGYFGLPPPPPRPGKTKFARVKSRWKEHFLPPSELEEGEVVVLRKTRLCYHEDINVTHRCDHSFQTAREVRQLQVERARLMRLQRLLHIGDHRTRSQRQREMRMRQEARNEATGAIRESERYLRALDQVEDPMTTERERAVWRIDVANQRLRIARLMDDVESAIVVETKPEDSRLIAVDTNNGFDRQWGYRRVNTKDARINHVMPHPRDIARIRRKSSESSGSEASSSESAQPRTRDRMSTIFSAKVGSADESDTNSYYSRTATRDFSMAEWFHDVRQESDERRRHVMSIVARNERASDADANAVNAADDRVSEQSAMPSLRPIERPLPPPSHSHDADAFVEPGTKREHRATSESNASIRSGRKAVHDMHLSDEPGGPTGEPEGDFSGDKLSEKAPKGEFSGDESSGTPESEFSGDELLDRESVSGDDAPTNGPKGEFSGKELSDEASASEYGEAASASSDPLHVPGDAQRMNKS